MDHGLFAELAAPWTGRKTGMDHYLRERLRNMDARPLRLMKEAGLATHTRTEEIDRVCEVTLAVEHLPGIRLRRSCSFLRRPMVSGGS